MLTVTVGLIFIILLLSLFATTVMELLAGLFGLRGRHLFHALKKMLADSDDRSVLDEFQHSAMYKQMSSTWLGRYYPPSYLESGNFRSILLGIVNNLDGERMQDRINTIPDESLRRILGHLLDEADGKVDVFNAKIEGWYNNVMDRASGWYKRYTQLYLVILGFAIAVGFNADTISIFETLRNDPSSRLEVYQAATSYVQERNELSENNQLLEPDQKIVSSIKQLDEIVARDINAISNPLGIGWQNFESNDNDPFFWIFKILGWLVTAFAVSLGAPFWFDLLKKLVNIRSSGAVPQQTTTVIREVPVSNDVSTRRIEVQTSEDN
ncbi:MAG: hypothetical protein AB8G22_28825 [Saprospiraceae bacterium]